MIMLKINKDIRSMIKVSIQKLGKDTKNKQKDNEKQKFGLI